MERRIITTQLEENENVLENHLRPQYLSEYIGQEKAKEILKVYIEAAKKRSTRSCAFIWSSGTRKDDTCRNYCK